MENVASVFALRVSQAVRVPPRSELCYLNIPLQRVQ